MPVKAYTITIPAEETDEIYGYATTVPHSFAPAGGGSAVFDGDESIIVTGVVNEVLIGFDEVPATVWATPSSVELPSAPYNARGYCGSVYVPSVETADHMLHVFIDVRYPYNVES
jgi:hypothetical protein